MRSLLLSLVVVSSALAAPRPNIVVILSDDMGWSDIGCYGSEIPTPNLDRLASKGLRYTQFYNTARCCPTRASLLTGVYPHQAGVGHMTEDRGKEGFRGELNGRCATIAEALRPAGYRTYALGKWHVARNVKDSGEQHDWPLQRGFDRYYGTVAGGGNYFDPGTLTRDNRNISAMADPEYQPAQYYYTDALADQAVRFAAEHARDHAKEPFFMYVAFTAAHWPLHAPEDEIAKFHGRYDGGYGPTREGRLAKQQQLGLLGPGVPSPMVGDWGKVENKAWEARCMEVYAAQVSRMDAGIGKLTAELARSGALENTLIFYMQDNGGCAEEINRRTKDVRAEKPSLPVQAPDFVRHEVHPKQTREGWPVLGGPLVMPGPGDTFQSYGRAWANVSNTPFREYKHWVHEGGISTPLIAHWPAGIAAQGELRQRPGHLVDIMATCLDVAGAKTPEGRLATEGESLVASFRDATARRERAIFWEHEGNRALRDGAWKLVAKGPAAPWELYRMTDDRTEQNNLASAEPERVKTMAARWEAEARRMNVLPWIWKPQYGERVEKAAESSEQPDFNDDAKGSGAAKFSLKADADLAGDAAPRLVGKAFSITAEIVAPGTGVIVAQGGSSHGWSLHTAADGTLRFSMRHNSKLATANGPALSPGTLVTTLAADGTVTFSQGDAKATAKVPGPLAKHPADGLQVGRDTGGHVGDYKDDAAFTGKLGGVTIERK